MKSIFYNERLGSKANKNIKLCSVNVNLDELETSEEFRYNLNEYMDENEVTYGNYGKPNKILKYNTHTNGYTKILTFDDKIKINEEKETEDHTPELMVNIEFGGIGISLVWDGDNQHLDTRKEIVFWSIRDIQAILIDFKIERKIQLRIGTVQIDNQIALDTPFPVTLFNANVKKKEVDKFQPFFNLSLVIFKNVPDVLYFKKMEFLIQKIILEWDDELVLILAYFVNLNMEILNTTFTGISEIFVNSSHTSDLYDHMVVSSESKISQRQISRIPDWKNEEVVISKQQIYIKYYNSSPLFLKISFYSTMKIESDTGFNNFLKRFGLALNTIEGAPIKINALELRDVVGTLNDIVYILKDRYMIRLKRNLLSILGASSLIGNPIQLANNVSSGIKDFFYKPIEGFVEGPIEGGKGIVMGTGSLVKNTVQGTFGSTSSIFSSLSKGVLFLTNDKDYMKEREDQNHRNRPENILEGVGMGIKSAAKSFGSGITGVVTMPVSGAKKKGFVGFLTGTVKGVTGLVAKPISGAMDFISKTSEGIKNTTMMFEEGKSLKNDRIRLPRWFYSKERIFKSYDELHSFSQAYLFKQKKINQSDPFIDAILVNKEPIQVLVIYETKILKIHVEKDKVTLSLPVKWISKIEKEDKMIVMSITDPNGNRSKIKVDIDSKKVLDRTYNQFIQMLK